MAPRCNARRAESCHAPPVPTTGHRESRPPSGDRDQWRPGPQEPFEDTISALPSVSAGPGGAQGRGHRSSPKPTSGAGQHVHGPAPPPGHHEGSSSQLTSERDSIDIRAQDDSAARSRRRRTSRRGRPRLESFGLAIAGPAAACKSTGRLSAQTVRAKNDSWGTNDCPNDSPA